MEVFLNTKWFIFHWGVGAHQREIIGPCKDFCEDAKSLAPINLGFVATIMIQ